MFHLCWLNVFVLVFQWWPFVLWNTLGPTCFWCRPTCATLTGCVLTIRWWRSTSVTWWWTLVARCRYKFTDKGHVSDAALQLQKTASLDANVLRAEAVNKELQTIKDSLLQSNWPISSLLATDCTSDEGQNSKQLPNNKLLWFPVSLIGFISFLNVTIGLLGIRTWLTTAVDVIGQFSDKPAYRTLSGP